MTRFCFGNFEVDTDSFELRHAGETRHVEPLVFDLISFFVRNAGRIVNRDEIVEDVWKGRIVSEATISSAIKSVRKAIGDSGEKQSILQTIRGRGYRFTQIVKTVPGEDGQTGAAPNYIEPALPDLPSIAVMPFENMSSDPEQEFFSDGMTEDVITELSKISGLFVISRHSALSYKGKPVSRRQIGRELGVKYILEGSVRRAANRLRISTQLVDTSTEMHLWAEKFDRELADIFEVQSEVAHNVANVLAVSIKELDKGVIDAPITKNIEAYDLYLRSRQTPFPPTRQNILNARNAYQQVIALDPDFVGGHCGLALMHAAAVVFGVSADPAQDGKSALDIARTALSKNDGFASTHSALGLALLANRKYDEAVDSARKATELEPSNADAFSYLGLTFLFSGIGEEACDAAKTALRLDPQFSRGPYLNLLGNAEFLAENYAGSIDAFERNVARGGPMSPAMLHCWAAAYAAADMIKEAKSVSQKLLDFFPHFTIESYEMIKLYRSGEHLSRLKKFMKHAGLPDS